MNACIFVMSIHAMMSIYGHKLDTQPVDSVGIGDELCVIRIEGAWTQVHWSSGNIGHTGWLKDATTKQNAQPTEPTSREEEYAPQQEPNAPPTQTPQQQRSYREQPANPDVIVRPTALVMKCEPSNAAPYEVVYIHGHAAVIGQSGKPREYPVIDEHDNTGGHTFYVAAKRDDQNRTLYFAFDYSRRGDDVSAIRVKGPGYDARDKCFMDWKDSSDAQ